MAPGRIPIGYQITPAGRQGELGDLPLSAALSPDGRWLVVSNDGEGVQSLQLVNTAESVVAQTVRYPAPKGLFVGLVFSGDGGTLYASGGGENIIRRYTVREGTLTEQAPIPLSPVNLSGAKVSPFPAGIALTPDGARLLVADEQADAVTVIELATGAAHTGAAGHRPYSIVPSADGHSAYVTNLGGDTVSVLDLTGAQPAEQKTITVGTHPNKAITSPDRRALYVADGDSDQISVINLAANAVVQTISLAPYPDAAVGSNPDDLALAPDGRVLYVAEAGSNDIAVVDLAPGGGSPRRTSAAHRPRRGVRGDPGRLAPGFGSRARATGQAARWSAAHAQGAPSLPHPRLLPSGAVVRYVSGGGMAVPNACA